MPNNADTIAAIATAAGRGGVGIIRISGPNVADIATKVLGKIPPARYAEYLPFLDATQPDGSTEEVAKNVIDMGLALYFPKPHSFTGEDVLELHGHGGPVVLDMLLNIVIQFGARLARPGEFAERAYLNDKMDLAQAEAIADLIDSASEQAARLAVRSLQGEFSLRIAQLQAQLIDARMHVESAIDFPEEEIDFLADNQLLAKIDNVEAALVATLAEAKQGQLIKEGMVVVIAGRPNAGKSTLLNKLTGQDTAIVTEIPGTTRDVLRASVNLDGIPMHVIDTAGLRNSKDPVEQEGIRRAWHEIQQADYILYLVDAKVGVQTEDQDHMAKLAQAGPEMSLVFNKTDISAMAQEQLFKYDALSISAKQGDGIDVLRARLKSAVGYQPAGEGQFIARRRHVDAIERALAQVKEGKQQLQQHQAGELLAEDLRGAQQSLSEITGEHSADDLLGEIFSRFCIGK